METDAQMLHCDVLVIGGGIAGLLAALEARRRAERVVLVSKRKPGRSGNSAVTIAGFSAPVREEVSGGPAEHLRDTMEVGGGINDPGLVRTLASEAAERVMALEQFGIRFQRDDGLVGLRGSPGHSRPRLVNPEAPGVPHNTLGLSLTLPLLKAARERGVALLSDMPVHRLLLADGEVCGADALDLQAGARVTILAGAVVLAAGGAGQLYGRTSNALDATGDSYALGLVAGAALRDMEFVQFYPAVMTWPAHATISNSLFSDGVVLRNRHGERFMHRYDPANGDRAVRDVMSRAVFQEIQAGNGVDGGVYLDCTAIPPALLERRFPDMVRLLRAHSVDPAKQWVIVSPAAHFMMGGLWIDAACRTGIGGLFAVGEAAGGVHGANRLPGNALTEAAVFGAIAGREAAALAARRVRHSEPRPISSDLPPTRAGSLGVAEVRAEIRRTMDACASIVRTEAGLEQARAALREALESLRHCSVAGIAEMAACMETERMALSALAIVSAALERRESRGAHCRGDCPGRDDTRWLGSTRIVKAGDTLRVSFVAADPPPRLP